MLKQPMIEKLVAMRLLGMAEALKAQEQDPTARELSFLERFGLLVDQQRNWRENQAPSRRLKNAKLRTANACVEEIDYRTARGLDKSVIRSLTQQSAWVGTHENIFVLGPTGVGKSFVACASAQKACRDGYAALYIRAQSLFRDLAMARADGSLRSLLARLSRIDVLVIDDWAMAPLPEPERRDFWEICEDPLPGAFDDPYFAAPCLTLARADRRSHARGWHSRPTRSQCPSYRDARRFNAQESREAERIGIDYEMPGTSLSVFLMRWTHAGDLNDGLQKNGRIYSSQRSKLMTMRAAVRSLASWSIAAAALWVTGYSLSADERHAPPRPPARFMTVNGIRLHYLDWGGKGEPLLFLTALGGTADDFQALAVRLTDRFRVFGLTRRGQGESEKPATGYDTSTLVGDIKGFLDHQNIGRVILVGYSLAGNEMTEFATAYPRRTSKVVYLDAAYDLQENAELGRKAQLNLPSLPGADSATLELIARSNEYHPDYTRIVAPALGFFVTYDEAPKSPAWDDTTKAKLLTFWNDYGKAYRREQIDKFQRDVKKGRVVELHNTTHGSFIFDKQQQEILIHEMRAFLLTGR